LGVVVLHERLTPPAVLGIILLLAGLLILTLRTNRRH
jgi:drug/metabolite transporter (DMT)-like permease